MAGGPGSLNLGGFATRGIGRVQIITSYSDVSGTTAVNQVKESYDGWGNLIREWQSHSGAVDTGSTPSVLVRRLVTTYQTKKRTPQSG